MKEEKRTVFISKDGIEFTSKTECTIHEKRKGLLNVCPVCAGKGGRYVDTIVGYTDGLRMHGDAIWGKKFQTCPTCKGNGHIGKKEGKPYAKMLAY